MADIYTRADSLREYLTGAVSDGAFQDNASLSLGGFRSSAEALSLGITIARPVQGAIIEVASGANGNGVGTLFTQDGTSLEWIAPGDQTPGPVCAFNINDTKIVESQDPGKFLRVTCSSPFTQGPALITLVQLLKNAFGFDSVSDANATAGISQYRATMIRNMSSAPIVYFQRCIEELANTKVSDQASLPGSGDGIIESSSPFDQWPVTGWCRIESAGGSLKEIVYYHSRDIYKLNVLDSQRAQLGTSETAGSATDVIRCVPGIAIGLDPAGVQTFGSSIQTVANDTTAPIGVTWNTAVDLDQGLQVAAINPGQQFAIWMWRQIPAGVVFSPNVYNTFQTKFTGS